MDPIETILATLPERHASALRWFHERAGTVQGWPGKLADDTLLASKAKGIYKPAWSEYALSVRQTLDGPYPDKEPDRQPDGQWTYEYFQENPDPDERDSEFTNRGLLACLRDRVPVAVMRQVEPKPNVRYRILGLAQVTGWKDGYFYFASLVGSATTPASDVEQSNHELQQAGEFDPSNVVDSRQRTLAAIARRRGQQRFRKELLGAYSGRCAITECDAEQALEAAHITPYVGPETNQVQNGILLRADIHTLWDLGLVALDERSFTVLAAKELTGTAYAALAGCVASMPSDPAQRPSASALAWHRSQCGL